MDNLKKNEIDLFELLIKIYLILKKYRRLLLAAILVGILFAFIKNRKSDNSYNSSMIISIKPDNNYMYALTFKEFSKRFENNPAEEVIGILKQTDNLIKNGNIKMLAGKMNLNEEDIKAVNSLTSDYKFEKGEAPSRIISINVNASDLNIFKHLGKGLIHLINNNNYIKEKNKSDSLMLSNIIKTTDLKIKELDSLQKVYYNGNKNNEFIILKDKSFFTETVILNSLKEKLTNDLKNLKQVKIIEDFYIPKTNKRKISVKLFLIYIVLFLILALIIIFFIVFNQKAKEYQNKINKQ